MRHDQAPPILTQLATDHENGADLVHADLGVTPSNCPICHEEPHHAAGRRRTPAEQAVLGSAG